MKCQKKGSLGTKDCDERELCSDRLSVTPVLLPSQRKS